MTGQTVLTGNSSFQVQRAEFWSASRMVEMGHTTLHERAIPNGPVLLRQRQVNRSPTRMIRGGSACSICGVPSKGESCERSSTLGLQMKGSAVKRDSPELFRRRARCRLGSIGRGGILSRILLCLFFQRGNLTGA
jgi:hypothetical protein